jgi:2-methylcitrate dehydratase PrpD
MITPKQIVTEINDSEIGGELADSILVAYLCEAHHVTPIEAALAIEAAHDAGAIEHGYWEKTNWRPTR